MNESFLNLISRRLRLGLGSGLMAGLFVFPAVVNAQSDNEDIEDLEEFTITGTLIPRTEGTSPTPVLSIDRDAIERSGFQQVSDLIRNLPMNSGISEADATASFAADGAYVNLRGIGPNGTLVSFEWSSPRSLRRCRFWWSCLRRLELNSACRD